MSVPPPVQRRSAPIVPIHFLLSKTARTSSQPPAHRLYGKLLLTRGEKKRYLPSTSQDLEKYEECSALLRQELDLGAVRLPQTVLTDGYNTRQALSYNYRAWRHFFNDRQLLALGWLQRAIWELTRPMHPRCTLDSFLRGLRVQ